MSVPSHETSSKAKQGKSKGKMCTQTRASKKISLLLPSALLLPVSCLKISLKNKTETGATLKTRSDYSDSTATSY